MQTSTEMMADLQREVARINGEMVGFILIAVTKVGGDAGGLMVSLSCSDGLDEDQCCELLYESAESIAVGGLTWSSGEPLN